MKKLTLVLNWLCLALCFVAILKGAIRGQQAGGVLIILPFATALAVYHFWPKVWFVVLAFAANALLVIALGFFLAFAVAWRGQGASLPLAVWIPFLSVVVICSINLTMLWPYFRSPPPRVAG